jgi:hypothetical protein
MSGIKDCLTKMFNVIPVLPDRYYRTAGAALDQIHAGSGFLDNVSASGHYSADIVYQISVLAHHPIKLAADVRDEILYARLTLSASRFFTTAEKFVTMKMFFEQNPDGTFVTNDQGKRVLRHVFDIAMRLSIIPARVLAPVSWTLRIMMRRETWSSIQHLKKLQFGVGLVMAISYTGATGFSALNSVRNMILAVKEGKLYVIKEAIIDFIGEALYVLGCPWDNGLIMVKTHPLVDLSGAIINVVANVYSIVKHIATYDIRRKAGVQVGVTFGELENEYARSRGYVSVT